MITTILNKFRKPVEDAHPIISVFKEWTAANQIAYDWLESEKTPADLINISYYRSCDIGALYAEFIIDLEGSWVRHYQIMLTSIPGPRRAAVNELLSLINPDIPIGNLDLVEESGQIRYRHGIDLEDGRLSIAMLDNIQGLARITLGKYFPAIVAVSYEGKNPREVLAARDIGAGKTYVSCLEDEPVPTWEEFSGARCIAGWATEIKELIASNASKGQWQLIGHGTVVESADLGICEGLFRRVSADAGIAFVSILQDDVLNLPVTQLEEFAQSAPLLVYLKPGDWMLKIDAEKVEKSEADRIREFRNNLKTFMLDFNPDKPVIFSTSTYNLDDMADLFKATDLFGRRFSIPKPTTEKIGQDFLDEIGRDICTPSLLSVADKVGYLIRDEFDNKRLRALYVMHLRRKSAKENRQLEFVDLVEAKVRGTVESDNVQEEDATFDEQNTLAHEAGHAVVAMVDSAGVNTPEYLSIIPASDYSGISVGSYTFKKLTSCSVTYAQFRHRLRVHLAGRAAEEVIFGAEQVTGGSREDLQNAHKLVAESFACRGFAPHMEREGNSGSNLAVILDEPSDSEEAYLETLIRQFMADQYLDTVNLLIANRSLLDDVMAHLREHKVLDQDLLAALGKKHRAIASC